MKFQCVPKPVGIAFVPFLVIALFISCNFLRSSGMSSINWFEMLHHNNISSLNLKKSCIKNDITKKANQTARPKILKQKSGQIIKQLTTFASDTIICCQKFTIEIVTCKLEFVAKKPAFLSLPLFQWLHYIWCIKCLSCFSWPFVAFS